MKSKYAKHLKNAQVLQKYVLEEFAHEKQYQKFADALLDVVPEIESKVKVFG